MVRRLLLRVSPANSPLRTSTRRTMVQVPITAVAAGTSGTARSARPAASFRWWSKSLRKSPPASIVSASDITISRSRRPCLRYFTDGATSSMVPVVNGSLLSLATQCSPARGVVRPSGAPRAIRGVLPRALLPRFLLTRQVPFLRGRGVLCNHHYPS